jgi:hypothetical protein
MEMSVEDEHADRTQTCGRWVSILIRDVHATPVVYPCVTLPLFRALPYDNHVARNVYIAFFNITRGYHGDLCSDFDRALDYLIRMSNVFFHSFIA